MANKTIAIVGAGPGLGVSVAKRFGREGFRAALVSRKREKLDALVAELKSSGVTAEAFVADVTDEASIKKAFQAINERFGAVDVLEYSPINIPTDPADFAPLEVTALTPANARKNVEIMALGAVASVQQVLPAMLERGSGAIFITTGIAAKGFLPMVGAWGLAGSAARNYARTLNVALRDKGVFAASVCLGVQIQKGDQFGDPDQLADKYYALYRDRDRSELFINHTPPGMVEFD